MDYTGMFGVDFFQTALDSLVSAVAGLFTLEFFQQIIPLIIIVAFVVFIVFSLSSLGFGIFNNVGSRFGKDSDNFISK